jgi:hypothetical protein
MSDARSEASFDPTAYAHPPEIAIDSGLRIAAALLSALRENDSAHVRAAAMSLRKTALAARQAWSEWREGDDNARAIDVAADEAWGAFYARLKELASDDASPNAARVRKLERELFGDKGARFLDLSYEEQYEQMKRILEQTSAPALATELDAVLGPGSLDAVRAAQEPYAALVEALRGDTWVRPVNVTRATYVRALSHAIHRYAQAVLAGTDRNDAATVVTARRLLGALDQHEQAPVSSVPPTAAAARVELPEVPGIV